MRIMASVIYPLIYNEQAAKKDLAFWLNIRNRGIRIATIYYRLTLWFRKYSVYYYVLGAMGNIEKFILWWGLFCGA